MTYPLETNMTNASLLDELGKSPVNPFPRNVRLSRGVKGGKGFTSGLKLYLFITPVSTRRDPHLRTRLVPQLAGWLAAWKDTTRKKYHATIFLTYTQAPPPPPNGSPSNYIPDKIFFFNLPCQTRKTLSPFFFKKLILPLESNRGFGTRTDTFG